MADKLKPKSFAKEESELGSNSEKSIVPKKSTSRKNQKSSPKYGIPKAVANRMARRVAITTGIPTISGMGVFVVSYLIVSKGILDIAPAITLLTSAACFLLGLLGLSFGILSSSWEVSQGSFLGLENIRPNIGRVKEAFKSMNKSQNKE